MAPTRVGHDWGNKKQSQAGKRGMERGKGVGFVSQKKDSGNFVSVVVMLASVDLVDILKICKIEDAIRAGPLFFLRQQGGDLFAGRFS